MIERILGFFSRPHHELTPMPEADARHALGALLVRVAKADGAYLFQEIEEIDHLLADLYDLNAVEAARMRAECEKLEGAMPDTNALANVLTASISGKERDDVVAALWKVADADGQRHDTEEQVVAIATQTFGMAPEAAAALR